MDKHENDPSEVISQVLVEAEKRCMELMIRSVKAKDSKGMELAGHVTIQLRDILERLRSQSDDDPKRVQRRIKPNLESTESASKKVPVQRKTTTSAKKRKYPKFVVDNGSIVKVGWSKKGKGEYIHKMGRDGYEKVADAIRERTDGGRTHFTAEEIIESTSRLEEPVPAYQIYIVLGFLQARGLLDKNGRRGYALRRGADLSEDTVWRTNP